VLLDIAELALEHGAVLLNPSVVRLMQGCLQISLGLRPLLEGLLGECDLRQRSRR